MNGRTADDDRQIRANGTPLDVASDAADIKRLHKLEQLHEKNHLR